MLHSCLFAFPDGPSDESYYFASFRHTDAACYNGIGCEASGDFCQVESLSLLDATADLLEVPKALV